MTIKDFRSRGINLIDCNKKILVLGGYGNFGRLNCDALIRRSDVELIVAGRRRDKAERCCEWLKAGGAVCPLSAPAIDVHSSQFLQILQEIHPDIVIHTCGPFQGQDYHVPRACILTFSGIVIVFRLMVMKPPAVTS